MFNYVKACNTATLNGCNDWFIASEAEQDKLRASHLVTWYTLDRKAMWTSVEFSDTRAYYWHYDDMRWGNIDKFNTYCAFAARAF